MVIKVKFYLLLLFISTTLPVLSQDVKEVEGDAAFLFAYSVKEGQMNNFVEGYKKHLQWHMDKNDPLPWYAWFVFTGNRLGLFIDGTFGISFEAFDNRVAPREDYQDFLKTTAPFVDANFRQVLQLKRDLSTIFLLEEQKPTSQIDIFHIELHQGTEVDFEKLIRDIVSKISKSSEKVNFTTYKILSGSEHPKYIVMAPRNNFKDFNSSTTFNSFTALITNYQDPEHVNQYLGKLTKSIKNTYTETWRYRVDLSAFSKKE